jgi:hypothetical protein
MIRKIILGVGLAIILLIVGRGITLAKGKIIAESLSPDSSKKILVRCLEQSPYSLAGFLNLGDASYRLEFYLENGPRMLSCITYTEDSLSSDIPIKIDWIDSSRATVEIGSVSFFLKEEEWSRRK